MEYINIPPHPSLDTLVCGNNVIAAEYLGMARKLIETGEARFICLALMDVCPENSGALQDLKRYINRAVFISYETWLRNNVPGVNWGTLATSELERAGRLAWIDKMLEVLNKPKEIA